MDMEGALLSRLTSAPAIASQVGGRVHWVTRPEKGVLPAITLQHVTDERGQSYTGFDEAHPASVQIDVWATTYAQAKALKEAVIAVLAPRATVNGIRFDRGFMTARDLSERTDTQFIFRPSMDFTFYFATA